MRIEPADIDRAHRIVKRAFAQANHQPVTNRTPVPVNPHDYNKLSDYQTWFHPPSVFSPPPPPRPGFWSSLGKSTLGAVGRTPVPWYSKEKGFYAAEPGVGDRLRSFVGLSPGRSGLRNLASGAIDAAGDLIAGDPRGRLRGAWQDWSEAATSGLSAPYARATQQSKPYQGALADWVTGVDKGTRPGRTLRPGSFPGVMSNDMQMSLLHPVYSWQNRAPTQY